MPSGETAVAGSPSTRLTSRAVDAIVDEIAPIRPRWIFFSGLARLFPTHALCRLRTALYRLGGLRIGPGTLLYGPVAAWGAGDWPERLSIGAFCRINTDLHIEA